MPADAAPTAPRRRLPTHVKVTGALGAVILIGALAAGHPKYAVLAPAPYIAWLLWRHTAARLCFVVLGGLFVLFSGVNHLTISKAGYFAGVALAAVAILRQPELWRALRQRTPLRALAPLTPAIAAIILVSFPVAHAEHTQLSSWFRDAAAYGLLATVPLFIWDASRPDSVFARVAPAVLYTAAILSGLSGILEWLARRRVVGSGTSIDTHILPGEFLPAAAAFLLIVEGSRPGRRHGRWYAAALAFPLCIFLGGTREAALLFVCVAVAAFVYTERERRRHLVPWAVAIVVVGILAVAAIVAYGHAGHPGVDRIANRITSIPGTILHPHRDQSYQLRASEWHLAWETFKSHPILGVGLGHTFVWSYGFGGVAFRSGYNLDTPLVYLAKFGLLGLLALAVVAIALVRFARLARASTQGAAGAAFAWFLAFTVLNLPFEMPFEAKDFTLALVVLGGLAACSIVPAPRLVALWKETVERGRRAWNDGRPTTAWVFAGAGAAVALILVALLGWTRSVDQPQTVVTSQPVATTSTQTTASPPTGKAAARVDARIWLYSSCGGRCRYTLTAVGSSRSLWELHLKTGDGPACYALDTTRFRHLRHEFAGIDRIACRTSP